MRVLRVVTLVFFIVGICICGQRSFAQSVYGSVKGTLTDVSGKTINGAKVTIASVGKGTKYTTLTDKSGFYSLSNVPPDDYSLKIEAGGFKTFQNPLVTVYADNTSQVDPKLVAGRAEEVTTGSPADVSVLKIDRTDVATILSRNQITDLPLAVQNISTLEVLAPGAVPVTPVLSRAQNPQQGTYININGQIFSGTAYQLDGTDNRDALEGIVVINPNQDSVAEMKITTQNYSAEFGEATAGVVNVQTKSGSNEVHGSAFGYSESAVGEASSPFLSSALSNLTARRSQFGGSVGGPILKSRLFFFGDYRGNRDALGATIVTTVPTQTMHQSCDSATSTLCDLSDYGGPTDLTPNAATAYMLTLLPEPNLGNLTNNPLLTKNYQASGLEPLNSDNADLRLDYDSSQRMKLFARYSYDWFQQDGSPVFPSAGGPGTNPDFFAGHARTYNQSAAAGFTYSFNPHLLTDFRFGYLTYHLDLNAPDFGTYPVQSVLPALNNSLYSSDMPDVQVDGYWRMGYSAGANECNCPLREHEQQFQFVNNWTRMASGHVFRWGGDFRYIRNFRLDSTNSRSGFLEFSNTSSTPVPNQVQNFVAGSLAFFDRIYSDPSSAFAFDAGERQKRAFLYGEDTWRINPRLTVNYGLRWEVYFPQLVSQAGGGGFLLIHNNTLPAIDAAAVNVAGTSGVNQQGNVENTFQNFGPRVGIAYLAGSKTVLRAGYGRSFDVGYSGSLFGIAATQNPPVAALLVNRNGCNIGGATKPCQNYYSISMPTTSFTVQDICNRGNSVVDPQNCVPTTALAAPTLAMALNALPARLRVPTVDAWNLTIQHQLASDMYAEVAYVGNKGTHVLTDPSAATTGGPINLATASYYNLNQPNLRGLVQSALTTSKTICSQTTTNNSYCLLHEFARTPLTPWNQPINYYGNNASNNYNSLQVKFNKRFSAGYSVLANYVYSKILDYDNNYFAVDPQIGFGPGNFDRRHSFTMANIWSLPIGRGKPLLHDLGSAADKVIGGWSIQALTSWYSGLPFTPGYSKCPNDLGSGGANLQPCRPNIVGPVKITGNRSAYYTRASNVLLPATGTNALVCGLDSNGNPVPGQPDGPWQRPGCGQIGDAGRNSLRGPQFFQSDIAVMKEISLTERVSLRLRADAFNAFNRVNLGQPDPIVDDLNSAGVSNAGVISSTAPGSFQRQLEFSAKVQF